MKRYFSRLAPLLVALLLAACSSAVKLNDVPVVDKSTGTSSGSPVSADPAPAAADSAGVVVSKGAVETVNLAPATTPVSANSVLDKVIYFDYDSYAIRAEFQSVLEAQAKWLSSDKRRKVTIEGHTDERGGREYNLSLGQKRAEAVRRALSLLGVSDGQLEAISYGKEKPAESGNTEAALAKNRRAEISTR